MENLGIPLETLVGNILGCIQVPPAGGPQVRFSIGAGDRQALQPPISPSLPITHTSVNLLFQQLGNYILSSIIKFPRKRIKLTSFFIYHRYPQCIGIILRCHDRTQDSVSLS